MAFKTPLEAALAQLKASGRIRSAADVGRELDYSRGTLSMYINGKIDASEDFITKFESHYAVRLSDYAGASGPKKGGTPEAVHLTEVQRFFDMVEKLLQETKITNETNLVLSRSNETLAEAHLILAKDKAESTALLREAWRHLFSLGLGPKAAQSARRTHKGADIPVEEFAPGSDLENHQGDKS